LFARDHQTYVFKWKNQTQKWKNKPADLTQLYEENETLWQYFVPGADAFLNRNINAQLGLANGTQVVCHSLTLDPSGGDFDRLSTLLLERNLPYGSEVIMDQPPLAVNMRILPGLDGKLPSKHKQRQLQVLRQFSIDGDAIVIPINSSGERWKKQSMYNRTPSLNNITKTEVKKTLAFDLSFSMTVHKAQGRTIPRVVIALTSRTNHIFQMEYASIFVGMSRVASSDDIRLLEHNPAILHGQRKYALAYLTALLPNKHLNAFYKGYTNNNGLWNSKKALRHRF